eukprot:GILJ01004043.1.p1 GENE.GILJ01004043.1~~GILJ01004043.1.p1  ORF type:complete len:1123 (-),score=165.75 GILJ01004043.1:136-3504(-)
MSNRRSRAARDLELTGVVVEDGGAAAGKARQKRRPVSAITIEQTAPSVLERKEERRGEERREASGRRGRHSVGEASMAEAAEEQAEDGVHAEEVAITIEQDEKKARKKGVVRSVNVGSGPLTNFRSQNSVLQILDSTLGRQKGDQKAPKHAKAKVATGKGWAIDADNRLSYAKMKHETDRLHPRLVTTDGTTEYLKPYPLCGTSTGWHFICGDSVSGLSQYGVGVTLYFKFLKYLAMLFFFLCILNVPVIIYNYFGTALRSDNLGLAYTTFANLGDAPLSCSQLNYTAPPSPNTVSVSCPFGLIDAVAGVGMGAEGASCEKKNVPFTECLNDVMNFTAFKQEFAPCLGQSSCSLNITAEIIGHDPRCVGTPNPAIFLQAVCRDNDYKIFGFTFQKTTLTFVIIGFDLVGVLVFLALLPWLKSKQSREVFLIDMSTTTAADYTVMIRNLPSGNNPAELKPDLWDFLERILSQCPPVMYEVPRVNIVDIQLGFSNSQLIDVYKQVGEIRKKNEFLEGKVVRMLDLKMSESKCSKLQNQIVKNELKIEKLQQRYQKWKTKNQTHALCAFVTFEHDEGFQRCLAAIGGVFVSKQFKFQGKRVRAAQAPEPSDIIWENLGVSPFEQFLRKTFTAFIAFLLLCISFGVIYFVKTQDTLFSSKYPSTNDCPASLTTDQVYADTFQSRTLIFCYCSNALANSGFQSMYDASFGPDNEKLCQDWFQQTVFSSTLKFLVAFVVLIVNTLLRLFMRGLAAFEKHSTKSGYYAAAMMKMFIAMFINTAFIVLIINANLRMFQVRPPTDLVFQGPYSDFNADWYKVVGTSIMVTMILNVLAPHLSALIGISIRSCKRRCDRHCTSDRKRTKKLTQREYEDMYTGPEFLLEVRYAQILNTVFVSLLFSSGVPMLVVIAFFTFLTSFWMDKLLFLRIYRTPPMFDQKVAVKAVSLLPVAAFLHLLFAIWMYSASSIFKPDTLDLNFLSSDVNDQVQSTVEAAESNINSPNFRLADRLNNLHTFFVVFGLVVFLIGVLFHLFVWPLVRKCCCRCRRSAEREDLPNFYKALNPTAQKREIEKIDALAKSSALDAQLRQKKDKLMAAMSRMAPVSRQIKGLHSYDMMDSKIYQHAFGTGQ